MAKPDYTTLGVLRPLADVSEIIPNLFQGIRPRTYRGYDLVVSCEQFLVKAPMESYDGMTIHIPMWDDDEFKIPEPEIGIVSTAIAEMLHRGGKVLVHCTGGLNRSSLVTVTYLIDYEDLTARDAVTLLRTKRDLYCLCNKTFERWVLGEQLPTEETSTFRVQD